MRGYHLIAWIITPGDDIEEVDVNLYEIIAKSDTLDFDGKEDIWRLAIKLVDHRLASSDC